MCYLLKVKRTHDPFAAQNVSHRLQLDERCIQCLAMLLTCMNCISQGEMAKYYLLYSQ